MSLVPDGRSKLLSVAQCFRGCEIIPSEGRQTLRLVECWVPFPVKYLPEFDGKQFSRPV